MSNKSFGLFLKTSKKLTATEITAVQEICALFTTRIIETCDISSLLDEIFVSNFIERLIKEKKKEIFQNTKKYSSKIFNSDKVPFVPFLYFKSDLLDKAPQEEWKRLFISIFNFKQFESILHFNSFVKLMKSNPEIEFQDFFKAETFFIPEILELFNNNSNLKGYIQKNFDSEPIKTITELKKVNETLEKGLVMLKNVQSNNEIFEASKRFQETSNSKPFFGEKVEINSSDFFGFISGTRFISVYLPPGLKYFIVKEKENYKILLNP